MDETNGTAESKQSYRSDIPVEPALASRYALLFIILSGFVGFHCIMGITILDSGLRRSSLGVTSCRNSRFL